MAQRSRPRIGINVDYVAASKTQKPHVRLNLGYMDSILAVGGMPVLMPLLGKDADIEAFLDHVDGFVLTGGLDMNPRKQGMPMHSSIQMMPARREEHDTLLVRQLMQRQMPLLAIGVGMHQVNVAAGGTLFMHLPEDMPRSMPHCDPSCSGPHRHLVLLEPDTRMQEIYGGVEIRVNSSHHQAVRQVGTDFRICAKAPDGVIEAMESTDPNWMCLAVQWQPDSDCASALDMQLFECFVQTCDRQAQPLTLALAA